MPDPLSRALAERLFSLDATLPDAARPLVAGIATYGLVLVGLVLLAAAWAEADRWTLRARLADTAWIVLPALIAAAVAVGLANLLGALLPVSRPFVVLGHSPLFAWNADASFPSDHVTLGVALLAAPLRSHRAQAAILLLSLLVGAARLVAGVHWLADVVGAAVLGLLVAFIVRRAWVAAVQRPGRDPILTR